MYQQPENVFGRRRFLQSAAMLGLVGLAGGTLASCGSPSSSSSSPITFWNLFGGGDGARMVDMEQAFQQQNPSSNFKAITLAWGSPYYTKLAMSVVGGSPPNAAITHLSRLHTYAAANILEPIDIPFLAQYGVTENDFLPAVWARGQFNGKLYALALDTHPFVMYYNVDVCRKAGLLNSDNTLKPLQGPDALTDAFLRTQKVTGNAGLSLAVQDTTVWRLFNGLYKQLGGDVLSPNGTQFTLNEAHAEQALTFMSNLTLKSKVANPNIDYAGSVALFGGGKAGFHWNGEWEIPSFEGTMNFNVVPFPNVFGGQQTWADSHAFIIPRGATPDQATKAATYQFIAGMLKQSLTWAKGGHIPAYLPVAESAEYKALKPQSNYASDAAVAVLDPPAWFSGAGSQFEAAAQNSFEGALTGQTAVLQSLQLFQSSVQRLLDQPVPLPRSVNG
jgi:multiple sugar transport system substrate-binding protein